MLPGSVSLQYLSHYRMIDLIISQKLAKDIIIKLLCSLNEDSRRLTNQLVPFVGYRSVKISLPKTSATSLLFIIDKQDIFLFQSTHKDNNTMKTMERIKEATILLFFRL